MKHITKILLVVTLACSLLLCSCNLLAEKEKVFTVEEMSITLTNRFIQVDQEGFTATYGTEDIVVFAEKIAFNEDITSDWTTEEYAELVIESNEMEDVTVKNENNLTCYTYNGITDEATYTYYAVVYKSDSAFWLVQFATESDDFNERKDTMITYAQSVTFS